jgi:hypothetical protein
METTSICPSCRHENKHEVDHNGQAQISCKSCSATYSVQVYQVRAKGGQRDRRSGLKNYNIRVKEPDHDETLLQFVSDKEIEMRSGDWITGSFIEGRLKYLINQTIHHFWDVQPPPPPPPPKGCMGCGLLPTLVLVLVILTISVFVLQNI